MSTFDSEHLSDVDAAISAGVALAGPQPIDEHNGVFTQVVPAGATLQTIDVRDIEAKHAAHPERKTGTVFVQDATSFIDYIAKHAGAQTEIWADLTRLQLVGVINAHDYATVGGSTESVTVGKPGHGDHRVVLELNHSRAWKTWTDRDKKFLDQQAFAEHLEDNAVDIVTPDAATMLEISQTLVGATAVDWKNAVRLDNGQVSFRYEETATARAGEAGDLEIPLTFEISIPAFDGAEEIGLTARFRYRLRNGQLALSYALLNTDRIARNAFIEIVDTVRNGTAQMHGGDIAVLHGRPA
jgi:uncharacterized protein YfdQ (DUF2303 family)